MHKNAETQAKSDPVKTVQSGQRRRPCMTCVTHRFVEFQDPPTLRSSPKSAAKGKVVVCAVIQSEHYPCVVLATK